MKKTLTGLLCLSMTAFLPTAQADETAVCGIYGTIGSVTTEVLMDRTFRDVLDMMQGRSNDITNAIGARMVSSFSSDQLAVMSTMTTEDSELIGGAAGTKGFNLLLSGRASSPDDVRVLLQDECMRIGIETIKNNQRQAAAASSVQ